MRRKSPCTWLFMLSASLLLSIPIFSQNKTITGKVTDETGAPVAGANIVVRGTKNGTTSATDGSFRLSAPANAILIISVVGYKDVEMAAGASDYIEAKLAVTAKNLNEVVVTALGVKR